VLRSARGNHLGGQFTRSSLSSGSEHRATALKRPLRRSPRASLGPSVQVSATAITPRLPQARAQASPTAITPRLPQDRAQASVAAPPPRLLAARARALTTMSPHPHESLAGAHLVFPQHFGHEAFQLLDAGRCPEFLDLRERSADSNAGWISNDHLLAIRGDNGHDPFRIHRLHPRE